VDSVWEQKKLEARKMLENAARREAAVPTVHCTLCSAAYKACVRLTLVWAWFYGNYD
jgi:hypothetical protein